MYLETKGTKDYYLPSAHFGGMVKLNQIYLSYKGNQEFRQIKKAKKARVYNAASNTDKNRVRLD